MFRRVFLLALKKNNANWFRYWTANGNRLSVSVYQLKQTHTDSPKLWLIYSKLVSFNSTLSPHSAAARRAIHNVMKYL